MRVLASTFIVAAAQEVKQDSLQDPARKDQSYCPQYHYQDFVKEDAFSVEKILRGVSPDKSAELGFHTNKAAACYECVKQLIATYEYSSTDLMSSYCAVFDTKTSLGTLAGSGRELDEAVNVDDQVANEYFAYSSSPPLGTISLIGQELCDDILLNAAHEGKLSKPQRKATCAGSPFAPFCNEKPLSVVECALGHIAENFMCSRGNGCCASTSPVPHTPGKSEVCDDYDGKTMEPAKENEILMGGSFLSDKDGNMQFGGDLIHIINKYAEDVLSLQLGAQDCELACAEDERCKTWTYLRFAKRSRSQCYLLKAVYSSSGSCVGRKYARGAECATGTIKVGSSQ